MDQVRSLILPGSTQSKADRRLAYKAMHQLAALLLANQRSVILDATYGPDEVRDELARMAIESGQRVHWIQCKVPPDLAVSRFLSRGPGHPAVDLTELRVRRQAITYPYLHLGLTLDSSLNLQDLAASATRYVDTGSALNPTLLVSASVARAV
jgi:hypothetical protein